MDSEAWRRIDPVKLVTLMLLLGPLLMHTAGCVGVQEAEAEVVPDAVPEDFAEPDGGIVECFHHKLADDGVWENRAPFGEVWTPRVSKDWRPYTDGHWVETDQGWGWVTAEPWGWAAYHYGRWFYAPERKWIWIPGTSWAPAWVAWRSGNGYLGWAPLPPAIGFVPSRGLDPGAAAISATHFYFIPERALLLPNLRGAILPAGQNAANLARTSDITQYKMVRHRIFDLGISPRHMAGIVGQPLQRLTVASLAAGAGIAHRAGPFYQPPALAQIAARSRREFGSTSNPGNRAEPRAAEAGRRGLPQESGRRLPDHQVVTRHANGMAFPARAGGHAAIASRAGIADPGTLQHDHRASFGVPSGRSQAPTRERGWASAAAPRTSRSAAVQPMPLRPEAERAIPLEHETAPTARSAAGGFGSPQQQSTQSRGVAPPSRSQRVSAPASSQTAHGTPARTSSATGHRPH